jgi:hypothetical protein
LSTLQRQSVAFCFRSHLVQFGIQFVPIRYNAAHLGEVCALLLLGRGHAVRKGTPTTDSS